MPDDLARVVAAWSSLPDPVKADILATVEVAGGRPQARARAEPTT